MARSRHAVVKTLTAPFLGINADGTLFASTAGHAVTINNIATGKAVATLPASTDFQPLNATFTPDGTEIAVTGQNSNI